MRPRSPFLILLCCALAAGPAVATTHTVTQSNFTFLPAELTISAGDTIQWVWTGGSHTVTNGTGALDPAAGSMFDESLSTFFPTVTVAFTEPGLVPYFCRPHELFGMVGTITVEAVSDVPHRNPVAEVSLLPNVPNPFNPQTIIRFETDTSSSIRLAIHDLAGRRVRLLTEGRTYGPGRHAVPWDGRDGSGVTVAAGAYIAVLEAGNIRRNQPLMLVK